MSLRELRQSLDNIKAIIRSAVCGTMTISFKYRVCEENPRETTASHGAPLLKPSSRNYDATATRRVLCVEVYDLPKRHEKIESENDR